MFACGSGDVVWGKGIRYRLSRWEGGGGGRFLIVVFQVIFLNKLALDAVIFVIE